MTNKDLTDNTIKVVISKKEKNIDVLKTTAHDLNNIFTSILNSIELLKIKIEDNDNSLLLKNIENNTRRASTIINNILLNETDKKDFDDRIVIKNLIYDLKLTLEKSLGASVKLKIIIDDNTSDIYGNYSDLFRVLLNLCINAKDAIDNDGIIKVSASNVIADNKNSKLINSKVANFVKIEVADNGRGISKHNINKIFNDGFSTKKTNKIAGLGLAIVKKIVEEHSGKIEVESEIKKGTTFKIYLPSIQKLHISEKKSFSKKILIVEDNKEIAEELFELLKYEKYLPTVAYNAETVLKLIEQKKNFDLFIVDKKMPGLNGIELIKKIREKKTDVSIILASGSILEEEKIKLKTIGINKYLKKPYQFEKLLQIIKELIDK